METANSPATALQSNNHRQLVSSLLGNSLATDASESFATNSNLIPPPGAGGFAPRTHDYDLVIFGQKSEFNQGRSIRFFPFLRSSLIPAAVDVSGVSVAAANEVS